MSDCDCQVPECSDLLCQLINAWTKLITGTLVAEVSFEDHTTKYTKADLAELKTQIRNLHDQCGNDASAAILGISGRRRPAGAIYGSRRRC